VNHTLVENDFCVAPGFQLSFLAILACLQGVSIVIQSTATRNYFFPDLEQAPRFARS